MIYVGIAGVRPDGTVAGGNRWFDVDSVEGALAEALADFHRLFEGRPVTYRIEVATEASPRRTLSRNLPLPMREGI